MPENWAKRAEYWYGVYFRVQKGVEAWSRGDIGDLESYRLVEEEYAGVVK